MGISWTIYIIGNIHYIGHIHLWKYYRKYQLNIMYDWTMDDITWEYNMNINRWQLTLSHGQLFSIVNCYFTDIFPWTSPPFAAKFLPGAGINEGFTRCAAPSPSTPTPSWPWTLEPQAHTWRGSMGHGEISWRYHGDIMGINGINEY